MKNDNLKKSGLKATLPRLKILELFEKGEEHHLSAEDIYKKLVLLDEELGLATIYRVLTQFEAANLIVRNHFEDGRFVYELNKGPHHDHVVCDRCGKVDEFVDETIENSQREVAEKFGFKITAHSLQIFGICPKCQSESLQQS